MQGEPEADGLNPCLNRGQLIARFIAPRDSSPPTATVRPNSRSGERRQATAILCRKHLWRFHLRELSPSSPSSLQSPQAPPQAPPTLPTATKGAEAAPHAPVRPGSPTG